MERIPARAFGPGFPPGGAQVELELTEEGVRVAGDVEARANWRDIELRRSGWDGSQIRLEWQGNAGRHSVMASGSGSATAIARMAGAPAASKPDRATRAWSNALLWLSAAPIVAILALVWQHERVAGWAVSLVPVEQEARLGGVLCEQQKTQLRLLGGPPQDMVRGIGERLARGSRYPFQFHVAEDRSVNAFAMPGGCVVVFAGLLELADTPEEVAGVLAHEVSHVEQRHSLRAMAQTLGLTAALALVFGDASGLVALGRDLVGLRFSRNHEREADREGLKALVAAGIRPQGMRDFFAKMAKQQALAPEFLSSHPASAERLAAIDAQMRGLPQHVNGYAPLAYDYAAVKAALSGAAESKAR